MVRKSVLISIFTILLLGCDGDVDEADQGRCGEGYVEQLGPDNTYVCLKIDEEG